MTTEIDKILETLLSELTEKDFDFLIKLQQLKADGWQIHHIIDADIIGNYCFPQGILSYNRRKAQNRKLTVEYLTDEQATLYSLFITTKPEPQGIILDEYIYELKAMSKVAQKAAKSAYEESGVKLEKWDAEIKRVDPNNLNFETLLQDVQNHLSQRVAEVSFGISGLEKFYNLLAKKRIIFEDSEVMTSTFLQAFDKAKGDNTEMLEIYRIFEEVINTKKFNSDSRERDSRAIQRVIAINRHILSYSIPSKVKSLFLFAIDAPSSTQQVFDKTLINDKIDYPLIEGRRLRFYITVQQIFAYLICRKLDDKGNEDDDKTIEELRLLKKNSIEIQRKLHYTTEAIGAIRNERIEEDLLTGEYNNFFTNYKSIRNNFENTGLFNNLSLLYNNIQSDLQKRNAKDLMHYFHQIQQKEKILLEEFANREKLLNKLLDEVNFNSIFITGIEAIRNSDNNFEWSKGDDEIEGTYQILPIFLQLNYYASYQKNITKIIELVIGEERVDDTRTYEDFKELISALSKVRSKSEYHIEERLLKALIFLILPNSSSRSRNTSNKISKDEQVIKWLHKIQNNNEDISNFKADLLYILCWVARRINKHYEAINIAKTGMKEFPTDPRFYHGRGLAEYCNFTKEVTKIPLDLDSIIKDIETAERLYIQFFNDYYEKDQGDVYRSRLSDCNNNSICFFLTEKASLLLGEDDEAAFVCLQRARKMLKNLKVDNKFKFELAEYYDTEAYLEYYESFFDDEFDSISKLENARRAIKEAIFITVNVELKQKYTQRQAMILARLNDLKKM